GHAVAVTPGESADPGTIGGVLEGAVAPIVEQAIPGTGGCAEGAALDAEDIEPAVTVVIQQGESAAEGLGQLVEGRLGIVVDDSRAEGLGSVAEGRLATGRGARACPPGGGRQRRPGPRIELRGDAIRPSGVGPVEPSQALPGGGLSGIELDRPAIQGTGLVRAAGGLGQPGQLAPLGRAPG